jgi:hypothetical protein
MCSYCRVDDELCCISGDGSCTKAVLITPEITLHHDQSLADATIKINEILSALPKGSEGRNLSILRTTQGLMLAWVHDDEPLRVTEGHDVLNPGPEMDKWLGVPPPPVDTTKAAA